MYFNTIKPILSYSRELFCVGAAAGGFPLKMCFVYLHIDRNSILLGYVRFRLLKGSKYVFKDFSCNRMVAM